MAVDSDNHIDIKVEYPQGAGGVFLSSVLSCCTHGVEWKKTHRVNFHNFPTQIPSGHSFDKSHSIIGIDSPLARYNFWVYYFRKRILWELPYYRYQNKKWIKCPDKNLDYRGDGFWLLDQARYIDTYICQQYWKIDWIEMIEYPEKAWDTIVKFIDSNQKHNFWTTSQWVEAVDDYRDTLSQKIAINPRHVHWQIWAIGVLQNRGITSEIDIIKNFGNQEYQQWLYSYIENTIDYTEKRTYRIG